MDLRQLDTIMSAIPVDTGGGSGLDKVYIMAELGAHLDLKTFIEIGVYRGRSFLPLACAFAKRGGFSYGIDPYNQTEAYERDIPSDIHALVTDFIASANYDEFYREFLDRRDCLKLNETTRLIRDTSDRAIEFFTKKNISADMIHVDGNHDHAQVLRDIKNYSRIMSEGAIIIIDDVNWPSVREAFVYAKTKLALIFETSTYAILRRSKNHKDNQDLSELCCALERHALRFLHQGGKPKVSVSMITYNQEKYIGKAIDSALAQEADFDIEIVIGEDGSTDRTRTICRSYRDRYPDKIHLIERTQNIGAVANYLETYKDCKGEYVAFLEGDDFWTDPQKLRKQVTFLDNNRDYAICFHNVVLTDGNGRLLDPLFKTLPDTTTAADLCTGDYISTPSCMIRNGQVGEVPDWLYTLQGCDWPFDILNAEQGKIKYLDEIMAAYRRHDTSAWSSLASREQYAMSVNIGMDLDRHFGFRYHSHFSHFIERNKFAWMQANEALTRAEHSRTLAMVQTLAQTLGCSVPALQQKADAPNKVGWGKQVERKVRSLRKAAMAHLAPTRRRGGWHSTSATSEMGAKPEPISRPLLDLVIVDDAFPHPQSSFRLEEYQAYLSNFERAHVFTSGRAFSFFSEKRTLAKVVAEHDARNPALSGRTLPYAETHHGVQARLGYTIFAGNAWDNLDFFERNNIPFVFTLYPGGSFMINDDASDLRLRKIFESPMFRRVIVTQKISMDYIIDNKFCDPEKIDFIYGVVTPKINLEESKKARTHYGINKSRLDICFTAHKYTPDGHDKGYDIFLDVAKVMAERFEDCHFHVVGGFSQTDLPLDGLEGRITFYGGQDQQWLKTFYQDKDLILLCNVPFIIVPGAFDGFPTGCGSDAMLNEVALFCTDPLNLNRAFEDGRDLVIVPHNVDAIVEKLSWYRSHPHALRELARKGRSQAVQVYSHEAQIAPRLAILNREIAASKQQN